MEIIFNRNIVSLTGSYGGDYGYAIQRRKDRFYSKRNSCGYVPKDGHWQFIVLSAKMAMNGLYVKDIRVSLKEFTEALIEAGLYDPNKRRTRWSVVPPAIDVLNAKDVLGFKKFHGL